MKRTERTLHHQPHASAGDLRHSPNLGTPVNKNRELIGFARVEHQNVARFQVEKSGKWKGSRTQQRAQLDLDFLELLGERLSKAGVSSQVNARWRGEQYLG